jgi:hypothetical protein
MPTLQHAVARVTSGRGIKEMVWLFQIDANLNQLATDPVTGQQIAVSHNGGGRFVDGSSGERRDWTGERLVDGAELAEWLLTRREDRFTPLLKEALAMMLSPEIAAEVEASLAEDWSRTRDWAGRWLRAHAMNMTGDLKQERWNHCT